MWKGKHRKDMYLQAGIVASQVKPLLVMLPFHMGTSLSPGGSSPYSASLLVHMRK